MTHDKVRTFCQIHCNSLIANIIIAAYHLNILHPSLLSRIAYSASHGMDSRSSLTQIYCMSNFLGGEGRNDMQLICFKVENIHKCINSAHFRSLVESYEPCITPHIGRNFVCLLSWISSFHCINSCHLVPVHYSRFICTSELKKAAIFNQFA